MNKPNRVRQALLVFLGGIVMALGIVGIGCDGPNAPLGTMCGHNFGPSLIVVALGSWFVLAVVIVLINDLRGNR
jgi:hypothetical protein